MVDTLRRWIAESDHIVFLGGAGVSTESGIPDFRSQDGLAGRLGPGDPPLEELLSHDFFSRRPEVFFKHHKAHLVFEEAQPSAAHRALAALERQGKLRAVITQNVDGLHQRAGSRQVLELHGSSARNYCVRCKTPYPASYLLDPANCRDAEGRPGHTPRCAKCGEVVRPDVVLYGEPLDERVLRQAMRAVAAADLLLVGGTSLVVYPAAGLISYFKGRRMVLINRGATPYDDQADLVIRASIGETLSAAVDTGG
ncbi:MAG: NAD-dependent protein deacylase [Clostridiales bacterium]|nr:NAD-dependent protein deacylase [Clostridiales bacterium]